MITTNLFDGPCRYPANILTACSSADDELVTSSNTTANFFYTVQHSLFIAFQHCTCSYRIAGIFRGYTFSRNSSLSAAACDIKFVGIAKTANIYTLVLYGAVYKRETST